MKTQNRFQETKIKMVMKLRGLTREAAIKELGTEKASGGTMACEIKHSLVCEEPLISAKEFFGEI